MGKGIIPKMLFNSYEFILIQKKYYQGANAIYLGKPEDYMYEKKYHYNTVYHLNDVGVT